MCSQLDTFPVTVTFWAETVPVKTRWTYFTGDSGGEAGWFCGKFLKISYRRGWGKQSVVLFFVPVFCYTVIESAEKCGVRVPFFGMRRKIDFPAAISENS